MPYQESKAGPFGTSDEDPAACFCDRRNFNRSARLMLITACLPLCVEWRMEAPVPCNSLNPPEERYRSLLRLCERCVNDAGFQSGMAGAARCELIERAFIQSFSDAPRPAEWQLSSDGALSCSAFTPDA
jgi:hypothetical protein